MTLSCTTCGSDEVMAVRPGCDEERAEAGILLKRGRPDEVYCWKHWPCRAKQPDLFEASP